MEYVGMFVLKLAALTGLGTVGVTTWIVIVLGIVVFAGLLGRLLEHRARKRSADRIEDRLPK
jgi:hypothetical protein